MNAIANDGLPPLPPETTRRRRKQDQTQTTGYSGAAGAFRPRRRQRVYAPQIRQFANPRIIRLMSRPQPHDDACQRLQLRDYQDRIIDEIREKTRGRKSLLVCAPTGAGKTIFLAEIVAKAVRKGYRAAVLVHRQELVKQTYAAVQRQCGVPPGVIWKGTFEWDAPAFFLAQNTVLSQPIPPPSKAFRY